MEWMMINLTRSQSSLSHLSRRTRGVMGRMALLLPLALPPVTLLASRASSTCDPNRDDRRRGLISCWMDTFISFSSVERQLVVWCPHLPGRLQVPCKLSLGSQDVSSGNTNTTSSLQDEKRVLTTNAHPWGVYSQTGKPWTPEIFLECYCLAREKPIRCEKTKPQARTLISLWFCGQFVLIFAVIGHNTINIPEIFQVFTVFPVTLWYINKPTDTQENEDDERAKYLFHDKSTSSVSTYFCVKRKEVKDHLTPCTLYPLY